MRIVHVVGARPNFMKLAPLHRELLASHESIIVHTGQHFDDNMSAVFFRELGLPQPDVHLGISAKSHSEQTGRIMMALEEAFDRLEPDLVVVVGDVNSTLAAALVCSKRQIRLAHVEAGLRSFDRSMPEEINRMVTDTLSDLLFVSEQSGMDNLAAEGIPPERVFFVGNIMIDSLVASEGRIENSRILEQIGVSPGTYLLATIHRPHNVDTEERLREVVSLLEKISDRCPVVFPVHPRTAHRLDTFGLAGRLENRREVYLCEPMGYIDFVRSMKEAAVVLTDSGGIQEETTYLQIPCLTLRPNTERPVTVELGTNELLPADPARILDRVDRILDGYTNRGSVPPLWDGKAAQRIAGIISDRES